MFTVRNGFDIIHLLAGFGRLFPPSLADRLLAVAFTIPTAANIEREGGKNTMTMSYETAKNNIWAQVHDDRDVDDLIFETEQTTRWEPTVSDR